jgi:hypothetical protein
MCIHRSGRAAIRDTGWKPVPRGGSGRTATRLEARATWCFLENCDTGSKPVPHGGS